MKVTALVCTCDRPDIIKSCIASVLNNTYDDFEFLVIDQSTDEKTKEIVEKHMQVDKRIRYIHMNIKGKSKGLNLGIKESLGDIIVMTDDDCIVPKDWFENIVETFKKNPDVGMLLGSVVDNTALFGERKGRDLIKDGKYYGRLSNLLFWSDGANMSVKRTVLEELKGFDELLGPGTSLQGEDNDISYRVLKRGFKILAVRNIIVTHNLHKIKDLESLLSVIGKYEAGGAALCMKHLRCLDFIAILVLFYRWLGRIFEATRFVLSVDKLPIKKPRVIFLLYSWFIITYWTLHGCVKGLQYPIDKTHFLFISK